jgi:hypothetical protein
MRRVSKRRTQRGQLLRMIRTAVREERYVIGYHANQRLRQREIPVWQILAGLPDGKLLAERPSASPNPAVEVEQTLADGTAVKTVWSWLADDEQAKLVTVHFFDQ